MNLNITLAVRNVGNYKAPSWQAIIQYSTKYVSALCYGLVSVTEQRHWTSWLVSAGVRERRVVFIVTCFVRLSIGEGTGQARTDPTTHFRGIG